MTPVISLKHVFVRLRTRVVIDDFSVQIHAGDFIALIGSNGAGKTTILRTIMGFLHPAGGEISLFGIIAASAHSKEPRKRIAYVPQAPVLDFRMPITVRDVVSIGRYGRRGIGRWLNRDDRNVIRKSIADVGIAHLADRPIGHLSGGEQQKVQIARALCQMPDVLLLDEPTGNLDLGAQHECLDIIGDIYKERRITTVIVMHDLQALPQICNRAVIMDEGRKVFDGQFADVFTRENLSHIYKHRTERVMQKLLTAMYHRSSVR